LASDTSRNLWANYTLAAKTFWALLHTMIKVKAIHCWFLNFQLEVTLTSEYTTLLVYTLLHSLVVILMLGIVNLYSLVVWGFEVQLNKVLLSNNWPTHNLLLNAPSISLGKLKDIKVQITFMMIKVFRHKFWN